MHKSMTRSGREYLPVMDQMQNDRWISLQEVCDYLGIKRHTAMRWIEQRNMPASKIGKLWRFKTSDIDEWVRHGGDPSEQEARYD